MFDAIIEKCRKLMAHAESAKQMGSLEEAEAFASKMYELLERHQLGFDAVANAEPAEKLDEEIHEEWSNYAAMAGLSGRQRVSWVERLVSRLAIAHRCRIVVSSGSGSIGIVGAPADREVVSYMAEMLLPKLRKIAAREYREAKKNSFRGLPSGWTTSWLCGAAEGIYQQLMAKQRALHEEAEQSGQGTALIRLDNRKEAVAKYLNQRYSRTASGLSGGRSSNAFSKGQAHGRSMNISTGVGSGRSSGRLSA